jgi:integrase/recombinase XerD
VNAALTLTGEIVHPGQELVEIVGDLARFDAAVPRFVKEKRAQRTKDQYERTLGVYRVHCTVHDVSPFGGDAVQTFDEDQRHLWQAGKLAADTVRLRFAVVKAFLTWCHEYGLSLMTPGRLKRWLHLPPARKLSGRDVLTVGEARALIAAARDERDGLLIRIMLDSGLRVSEALALRPCDLWRDENRCYLYVLPSKGEKDREVEIGEALHRDLVTWARERHRQPAARLFVLDPGNAWRMVIRTARAAGITKSITPHSLRHTHAHQLRLMDWPIEAIGERLGHSSVETTKRYTRPAALAQALGVPALPWCAVV